MDRTRENLTRVEDILSELTERVEPLKQQSEVAREYLALRDELKLLDLNVFLMRTERYETRIRELKESVQALDESILQANERLEKAGAASEAHTVVFTLPVENIVGLRSVMENMNSNP